MKRGVTIAIVISAILVVALAIIIPVSVMSTDNNDPGTNQDNGDELKFNITIKGVGASCEIIDENNWLDIKRIKGEISSNQSNGYLRRLGAEFAGFSEEPIAWYLDKDGYLYTSVPTGGYVEKRYLGSHVGEAAGTYDKLVLKKEEALVLDRKSIREKKYDPKLIPVRAGASLWPGPFETTNGQKITDGCSGFFLHFKEM
jgi:hypothetical protein